jgi:hypothetical protein
VTRLYPACGICGKAIPNGDGIDVKDAEEKPHKAHRACWRAMQLVSGQLARNARANGSTIHGVPRLDTKPGGGP